MKLLHALKPCVRILYAGQDILFLSQGILPMLDIAKEIESSLERITTFATNNPDARTRWGLSGGPLQVTMGADIESLAFNLHEKRKIGVKPPCNTYRETSETLKSLEESELDIQFKNAVNDACCDLLASPPITDSFALEVNPKEGSPSELIQRYFEIKYRTAFVAHKQGWRFAMGAGHFHITIQDPEAVWNRTQILQLPYAEAPFLTREEKTSGQEIPMVYSPFADLLANNIIALQCICPALFLRASRCEKERRDVKHTKFVEVSKGPSTEYNGRHATLQMNYEPYHKKRHAHDNPPMMFEMRAAHLAPYVPILMMLHAVEKTLEGEQIDPSIYANTGKSLQPHDEFVKGKGTYLKYIDRTVQSGYLTEHFPFLNTTLIEQSLQSYVDFLKDPTYSPMYTLPERKAALSEINLLKSRYISQGILPIPLEQGFSPARPCTTNYNVNGPQQDNL